MGENQKPKQVTVEMLIASLSKYPPQMPVQVAIKQYNKVHPVEYLTPKESAYVDGLYVTCEDGCTARIYISLSWDEKSFKFLSTKKIKR